MNEVIIVHEIMLDIGGGSWGILNVDLLHSAIERPKASYNGEYLYDSIFDMASAMLQSLAQNHPFIDANKRTAFFSTTYFLEKNDVWVSFDEHEVTPFMLQVVVDKISLAEIATWFRDHQTA